jgi:intracellular sulfur oxidation DsrE/DsrF family protein
LLFDGSQNKLLTMKKVYVILLLVLIGFETLAQSPTNMVISNYGTVYDIPDAVKPDPGLQYKIVIDLKSASPDPAKINPGLNNVARMLNLHAAGGIGSENMSVVVAIHGNATYTVLDKKGYIKKHAMENPNMELIRVLKNAGVKLFICGQSLIARNNGFENINPDITIALSMLTVVTEHQGKGYGLLQFD